MKIMNFFYYNTPLEDYISCCAETASLERVNGLSSTNKGPRFILICISRATKKKLGKREKERDGERGVRRQRNEKKTI